MSYYPPQPVYYAQPPPVVAYPPPPVYPAYAPAASSSSVSRVSTTNVTKVKQYGAPASSSYRKGSSVPSVTNKRGNTYNLNISRAPKKDKSTKPKKDKKSSLLGKSKKDKKSSVPKPPKKEKKDKVPKSPKESKAHSSGKPKKRLRKRKQKKGKSTTADKIGVQLSASIATKHLLNNFIEKMQAVSSGAVDGLMSVTKHSIFGVARENEGKLPPMGDVSMEIAFMVLRAMHSRVGRALELTFVNEQGDKFDAVPAVPTADSERSASVAFAMPAETNSTMDGDFSISISLGSQTFTHVGHSMMNTRLFRDGNRETFEWMINLYDPAYMHAYYKYMVPLPVVVLTMKRSPMNDRAYLISKAVLVVDFNPRKHLVSLPVKASDIIELPRIVEQSYEPFKAYIANNTTLHKNVHNALIARLQTLMGTSANTWALRCSGGEAGVMDDQRVFLGTVTEAAIAYAIMAMLKEKDALDRVNEPAFIKEVLGEDENGAKAIEVVRSLYDKYHRARGKELTDTHQDFPSLLQLLTRTSGLPSSRSIDCEQVRAYYDTVISAMSGGEVETPVELTYNARELLVLESFESAPGADNDAAVSVGPAGNTLELFLLAMFVRRFSSRLAGAGQTPADIVNAYLVPSDFKIDWGLTFADGVATSFVADPLTFSSCAATSLSGLSAHARVLSDELAQPSRLDSVFFRMMATRFPVAGESADVAHSVGWMQRRANDKLDVLFVGSRNNSMDTVVVAIVPQLHFHAVFHEMSADFDKPLQTSVRSVVDAFVDALNEESVRAQYADIPGRVTLDVPRPLRANKSWDTSFIATLSPDFIVDAVLPDVSVEFVEPFVSLTRQTLRTLRFEKIDKSGVNAQLIFSAGETVLLVYDVRRHGYFVRLFDEAESLLGDEAVITDKYIQYRGKVYIRRAEFDELGQRYSAAFQRASQAASADVFNTKTTQSFKQGVLRPLTPQAAFSLGNVELIGHRGWGGRRMGRGGAFLGGVLAGAAANRLLWGPYGPAYGYAYPRVYRRPVVVVDSPAYPPGYYY